LLKALTLDGGKDQKAKLTGRRERVFPGIHCLFLPSSIEQGRCSRGFTVGKGKDQRQGPKAESNGNNWESRENPNPEAIRGSQGRGESVRRSVIGRELYITCSMIQKDQSWHAPKRVEKKVEKGTPMEYIRGRTLLGGTKFREGGGRGVVDHRPSEGI